MLSRLRFSALRRAFDCLAGQWENQANMTHTSNGRILHACISLAAAAALACSALSPVASAQDRPGASPAEKPQAAAKAEAMDKALAGQWLGRWEKNIVSDARNRYCDREMGEEIGWLVSPFLNAHIPQAKMTVDENLLAHLRKREGAF